MSAFYFEASTECSLNIEFFLKTLLFFLTLPVLLQRWCSTCLVGVHTQRENRERPESGIFSNLKKETQYLMNTLYLVSWQDCMHESMVMKLFLFPPQPLEIYCQKLYYVDFLPCSFCQSFCL